MKKPRLDLTLVGNVLHDTLPQQPPELVGYTPDQGMILATYHNYKDCYVKDHNNTAFHTLEIMDQGSTPFHRRVLGDYKIESPMHDGDISICPAYANYFLDPGDQKKGLSFTLLALDVNLVEEVSIAAFDKIPKEFHPRFLVADTEQIKYLVNTIKQEIAQGYPHGSFFLESVTNSLITCFLQKSTMDKMDKKMTPKKRIVPSSQRKIKLVREFIEENLAGDWQLKDIAKYSGLSECYVSRVFKQEMGMGIITYHNQQRIERAKKLLRETSYSLIQIAQECGFCNDGYFNRCFKSSTGGTPAQFRAQCRKRIDI